MPHSRWPWWFVAALALGLALPILAEFAKPLSAQSPAPGFQAAGAVCPLSDEQTQQAIQAFDQLAATFTTEPRCVNCHGGVNPFAAGGDGHTGGKMTLIFQTQPVSDPGLAGLTFTSDTVDKDATDAQCQLCHSGLPGWSLAPAQDVFKERTAVQICQNQRLVFGKQLAQSPAAFANHIAHDVKNVPFIENAFDRGDRGLNLNGIEIYQTSTGSSFQLEKVRGVSHEKLNALAKQWADAMGSKFKGGDDCGCVPHHYSIHFDQSGTIDTNRAGMQGHYVNSGNGDIALNFKDDASFEDQASVATVWNIKVSGNGITCTAKTPQSNQIQVTGNVDDDLKMHLKFSWTAGEAKYSDTCTSPVGKFPFNGTAPGIDSPDPSSELAGGFEMQALVGETKLFMVPVPFGKFTYTITIKQID